jgi:hypothetical protein
MNPPPLPPLLSGSLSAGAIVSGATSATLLGVSLVTWLGYEQSLTAATRTETANENKDLQAAQSTFYVSQVAGFIALGTAAALGAAAVITGLSTDWEGYRDAVKVDDANGTAGRGTP